MKVAICLPVLLILCALTFQARAQARPEDAMDASSTTSAIDEKARPSADSLRFIANIGLTAGGSTLYTVQDSNGYSQRVSAGALFELGGGILWRLPERPLSLQLTANWHGDSAGTNSAVTFTRYPLEALAFYQPTDSMRFGLGMRYVLDPVSGARINNNTERIYFKNTLGTIVEAGYAIDREDWLNLRLVWEKYQPYACSCGGGIVPVQSSPSVNGFHVGVNWVIHFGDRGESTTAPAAVAEPGPTESYGLLDLLFGTHTGASDEHRRREAHDGHRENKRKEEIVTRNVVITPDPAK